MGFLAWMEIKLLTDFGGGHCDVVPHVRLSVQRLGQGNLPVVHVDIELPLQVCVSIDEVPKPEEETWVMMNHNQQTRQGQ